MLYVFSFLFPFQRILGNDRLWFPFPNYGNGFFSFPSYSRILEMVSFHSLPVPELREWVFSIPFPFPNFGNGIIHSRSRTPKCHSRSPLFHTHPLSLSPPVLSTVSQWAPTTKILEIFFHDVLWGFRFVYVVIESEKDLGNVDFLMELQFPVYFNLMMTFPCLKLNDPWMIISQWIVTIIGQCLRHRLLFFPLILW